ncbi:hypothetical protein [Egbenema bharatensis]|uniref:hypothetical protein n=1 Tax=Egbenema bharatensis TaxID=3463334 RepID=UPI003A86D417
MHPTIDQIFDNAEARYLKPEELQCVTQYVESLPERLETYRNLRDRELEIMQWVADQLQSQLPQENQDSLERCIKNALLMLRYCSMGMLLNDETLVKKRFLDWVSQAAKVYNTEKIDHLLHRLLNQRLTEVLGASQMRHLTPMLKLVYSAQSSPTATESVNGAAIGW